MGSENATNSVALPTSPEAPGCVADFNRTAVCCGQPGGSVEPGSALQCDSAKPHCVGYVHDVHYGRCRAPTRSGKVLVCVVGSARTFALPAAHLSILHNVIKPLGGHANVDVNIVLSLSADFSTDASTYYANKCTSRCEDAHMLNAAIRSLRPRAVKVLASNDCASYRLAWNQTYCVPRASWMQTAAIDQCFRWTPTSAAYTHMIRVRPDSFFEEPLPALETLSASHVTTWPKFDAPASDQFFVLPAELYKTWWLTVVAGLLRNDRTTLGCA